MPCKLFAIFDIRDDVCCIDPPFFFILDFVCTIIDRNSIIWVGRNQHVRVLVKEILAACCVSGVRNVEFFIH